MCRQFRETESGLLVPSDEVWTRYGRRKDLFTAGPPLLAGGAEKDPNFANVAILLHGDVFNVVDSGPNGISITTINFSNVDTSIKKWGAGSLNFNGSNKAVRWPNSSAFAFGTGAFDIALWFYAPSTNNDKFILSGRGAIGTMHITTGGSGGTTPGVLRYVGSSTITGTTVFNDSAFHYLQIARDGSNNITLKVDGSTEGTGTDTTNYTTTTGTWYCGENDFGGGGSNYLTGNIDDLRITKGVIRPTTVPTGPFPNS